jgi:hypothetical protein
MGGHRIVEQRPSRLAQGIDVNQVRPLRWHDFPLAYRLIGHGTSFDAQFSLTMGDDGLRQALITNSGNTHAYVLRQGGGAFAVLRALPGTLYGALDYMAPALDDGGSEEQWLDLICGMSILAGQQGIVGIRAEANDDTPEFALLREADFGVYARQTVWERSPRRGRGDQCPDIGAAETGQHPARSGCGMLCARNRALDLRAGGGVSRPWPDTDRPADGPG